MSTPAAHDQITAADELPLTGLKVLEFSHTVMGPCAGMLLAEMGADVIKVEATPDGDPTRHLSGFGSGMFAFYNRNKRSLALDCKSEAGRKVAHRLIAHCDVMIENFAPNTMKRLGCDWDTASSLNPRLIYLSLKGFLSGPYAHRTALDEVVQFMGGLAYMTGPIGRPLRAGASITDILGGAFGINAVLAALYQRERTHCGRLITSSLFESVAFMMGQFMAGVAQQGRDMPPMPHRESSWPVYDTFKTADEELVFIAATSNRLWDSFIDAFGLTELKNHPELTTRSERMAARSWTIPIIADRLARLTRKELTDRCEAIGVGWAQTAKPSDLFDDPHLNAGHMVNARIHGRKSPTAEPEMLDTKLPCLPLELDGRSLGLRRQAPLYGEHSREVLREWGVADSESAELVREGVVHQGTEQGGPNH